MSVSCKRKFEEVEEERTGTSPTEQRKSILDISMTKLRTSPHRKVEPSLRRSVLIFNTLKNIENQLKLEGVCVPRTSTVEAVSDLVPALQVPSTSEDILDALPNAQSTQYTPPSHPEVMDYHQSGVSSTPTLTSTVSSPQSANYSATYSSYNTDTCQPHINSAHYTQSIGTSTTDAGQPVAKATECSSGTSCSYGQSGLDSPSSSSQSENMYPVTPGARSPCASGQESWTTSGSEATAQPASSHTETVLSETSKFILDSILTSDKLISVASFTSLFELDNNELTTGNSGSSSSSVNTNLNNNSSSATPSSISAAEGIPPISCLCSKNLSRNSPYLPPSWSQSLDVSVAGHEMWDYSWSGSSDLGSCSSSSVISQQYQHGSGGSSHSTTTHSPDSSKSSSSVLALTTPCPPSQPAPDSHWSLTASSAFQGLSSVTAAVCSSSPSATSCRQESSFMESQSVFGDVDCSSFDFDLFLPSLSPSMKLTQLNHEDLIHSLPSPDVGFSSNCNSTPSLLNPKTESHGDELDRIMQIVVGI